MSHTERPHERFSALVNLRMGELGLTQGQVAKRMGYASHGTVGGWITENEWPREQFVRLCEILAIQGMTAERAEREYILKWGNSRLPRGQVEVCPTPTFD